MKKHVLKTTVLLLLAMLWATSATMAQNEPFITKWNTVNPASTIGSLPQSTNTQIYFPGIGTNYTIEWENAEDASIHGTETNVTTTDGNPYRIDFPSAGEYIVKVYPQGFERIQFEYWGAYGDQKKLTEIQQWGDVQWAAMHRAFGNCENMQLSATDVPNLTGVTDMGYMFVNCDAFNGDISGWDVSNVKQMYGVFYGCTTFNQDISSWDVSNAKQMYNMFNGCFAFNQDLGKWNIKSVVNEALVWSLVDMFNNSGMSCTNYGNTLKGWANNPDTPYYLSLGAVDVFYSLDAQAAHDKLINEKGWGIYDAGVDATCGALLTEPFITKWNTENPASDIEIGGSTVSSSNTQIYFPGIGINYTIEWEEVNNASHHSTITNINNTRPLLIEFDTPGEYIVKVLPTGFKRMRFSDWNGDTYGDQEKLIEIQQWGDVKWTSMGHAFIGCKNMQLSATADVPNLTHVTNMRDMFSSCTAFNQDISNWNVSNVISMNSMFLGCSAFNQDLSSWNVSNVTKMNGMFSGCSAFNQDLSSWNLKSVVHDEGAYKYSLKYMFDNSGMDCTNYGNTLIGWANNTETPDNLVLGASGVNYSPVAQAAHATLEGKGWTITDAGVDVNCGPTVAVTGVSLDITTATITAGNTQQLTATVAPATATNQNVTWSSSDNNIATVSPTGLVTAVAAGNATITVTTDDGDFTATCAVTVTPATVAVTGVSLDMATATITAGNTQQLTATVAPATATNQNVTWSSSDNNIATVSPTGLVTAVAAGNATITVTTDDGDFTATCAVTVTNATVAVTGVSLDMATATITAGNTQQLTATVAPATATNQNVTWSSSDNNIATVSPTGLVTAVAAGNATITVTTDDGGFTATCAVTVTAPAYAIDIDNHNFGVIDLAATATQDFTISNTGDANLIITGMTVNGTNAAEFTHNAVMPLSITPGNSHTFTVTFDPAGLGWRNAHIDIATNAGNYSVTLKGAATSSIPTIPVSNWAIILGVAFIIGGSLLRFVIKN